MKRILFLVPLVFFLTVVILTTNGNLAEAQQLVEEVKEKSGISAEDESNKDIKVDIDALDSQSLKELQGSTQITLDEKKKDISNKVVEGQQAMAEKEVIQNKVDKVKEELDETKTKIKETGSHDQKLKQKSRELDKKYQNLQNELKIKDEKSKKAFAESSKKQSEIEQLTEHLRLLELEKSNRYSPRKKALYVFSFLLIMIIFLFIKDKLLGLVEKKLIVRGDNNNSNRSLRARTFLRIFSWSISVLIIAITIFLILELFGFDSVHTIAGAGIFSIAIGFGAQQFIKDVFSGIFLVLEGQYGVNDFIAVGKHSGNVEDINLRYTKLRSYDGNIIYIPNGDIHSVVNYGKEYANSVINFYVDVEQNMDQVLSLVREVVSDLRSSPDLVDDMLGDVQLLGINAFTPTGIEVKFRIKTAPQSQWMVGREVRLALKQRLDLDGIKLFQYQYDNQWKN